MAPKQDKKKGNKKRDNTNENGEVKKKEPKPLPADMPEEIQEMFRKERSYKEEKANITKKIKELEENNDNEIKKREDKGHKWNEDVQARLDKMEADIQKAREEKGKWQSELAEVQKQQNAQRSNRDHYEIMTLSRQPLVDDCKAKDKQLQQLKKEKDDAQVQINRMKHKHSSMSVYDMEKEIAALDKKINECTGSQSSSAVSHLNQERNRLHKSKQQASIYWGLIDKVLNTETQIDTLEKGLKEKGDALAKINTQMLKLADQLGLTADNSGQFQNDVAELRGKWQKLTCKIDKCNEDIAELIEKKKKIRYGAMEARKSEEGKEDKPKSELDLLYDQRRKINDQMTKLTKDIPSYTVLFPHSLLGEIIGPGGETIKALEADYGCLIQTLDHEEKRGTYEELGEKSSSHKASVVVKGERQRTSECVAAIKDIIANASANRETHEFPIDSAIVPELIGARGAHIKEYEQRSGVQRLCVSKNNDYVEITGNSAAIAAAIDLLNTFVELHNREELSFPSEMGSFLLGKNGERKREVMTQSGCKNVHIDTNNNIISLTGSKEACAAAKEKFEEYMTQFNEEGHHEVRDDQAFYILTAFNRKWVHTIQKETLAQIDVRAIRADVKTAIKAPPKGGKGKPGTRPAKLLKCQLSITGTKDAVDAGRLLVAQLLDGNKLHYPTDNERRVMLAKSAEILQYVQKETDTMLTVNRDGPSTTIGIHSHDKDDIAKATKLVERILEGVKLEYDGETEAHLLLANRAELLNAIQADTNSMILVNTESDPQDFTKRSAKISIHSKDADACQQAKEQIEKLMAEKTEKFAHISLIKDEVHRQLVKTNPVAGKTKKNELESEFGVEISDSRGQCSCNIRAPSTEKLQACLEALLKFRKEVIDDTKVWGASDDNMGGGRGGGRGRGRGRGEGGRGEGGRGRGEGGRGRGGGRGRRDGDGGGEDADANNRRREGRRDREKPKETNEKDEEVSKEDDPLAKYKRYENWVPGCQGLQGVGQKHLKPSGKARRGKKKDGEEPASPDTNGTE